MKRKYAILQTSLLPRSQQGMVLIVGLVMVLLLSIIGLAAIRGSGLQETMAGNMSDRNVAFQTAESGLRVCEALLSTANKTLPVGPGYTLDLNQTPANSVINSDFWIPLALTTALALPNVASQPICIIEELNVDPASAASATGGSVGVHGMQTAGLPMPYRASALGVGASPNAQALTQSTYKRLFQ